LLAEAEKARFWKRLTERRAANIVMGLKMEVEGKEKGKGQIRVKEREERRNGPIRGFTANPLSFRAPELGSLYVPVYIIVLLVYYRCTWFFSGVTAVLMD
jgi:hypothetical protein